MITLTELTVALVIASGAATGAAVALDVPALTGEATRTADRATCRTIETAVVAYTVEHSATPATIAEVRPLVDGEVEGYRLSLRGTVIGPGCATGN
ncbi:MAG: hypothetical protein JXA67_01315 [Micromonosporaceae bacterium]|nr:hypothetical protein [Micromonosporaceae bacterium]